MANQLPLIAGLLIILAATGTVYYITNLDQTYYCEAREAVSMCFKLSNPNNGVSSRCYYNESAPSKYFNCVSGWKPIRDFPSIMDNMTVQGNDNVGPVYDANIKQVGADIYYNSTLAQLKVSPENAYSSSGTFEQVYEIQNKAGVAGKLCAAFAFPKGEVNLSNSDIYLVNEYVEYDVNGSNRIVENLSKVNSAMQVQDVGNQTFIYNKVGLNLASKAVKKVKIVYTPVSDSGKFDVHLFNTVSGDCVQTYQDKSYTFFYTIDPSWTIVQGSTATASNIYSATYAASKAVDNDFTTSWITADNVHNGTLVIDLGIAHNISAANITQSHLGNNYATKNFSLSVSDDNANWATFLSGGLGAGDAYLNYSFSFNNVVGRYLAINCTVPWDGGVNRGIGLSEVRLYGSPLTWRDYVLDWYSFEENQYNSTEWFDVSLQNNASRMSRNSNMIRNQDTTISGLSGSQGVFLPNATIIKGKAKFPVGAVGVDFSYGVWVYNFAQVANSLVGIHSPGTGDNVESWIQEDTYKLRTQVYDGSTAYSVYSSNDVTGYWTNQWRHVVVTIDWTDATHITITQYINGTADGTGSTVMGAFNNADMILCLNANNDVCAGTPSSGKGFDEFFVINRSLNATEVAEVYNQGHVYNPFGGAAPVAINIDLINISNNPRDQQKVNCTFKYTGDLGGATVNISWYNNSVLYPGVGNYTNVLNNTDYIFQLDSGIAKVSQSWNCSAFLSNGSVVDTDTSSAVTIGYFTASGNVLNASGVGLGGFNVVYYNKDTSTRINTTTNATGYYPTSGDFNLTAGNYERYVYNATINITGNLVTVG